MGTSQTRATNKHASNNYKRIYAQVRKESQPLYQEAARRAGVPLSEYIISTLLSRIEAEQPDIYTEIIKKDIMLENRMPKKK